MQHFINATELHEEIRKKNISVEEVVRSYLDRIDKYDKASGLNTIAEINESAIAQAKKLDSLKTERDAILFGLLVLVKDNIDVKGLHTTAGSLALADNIANQNADIINNIIKNGGIILGKTNMTEFANFTTGGMPNGFSSRGGYVKNAYDRNTDAGGSSTGSAVAVSAGFCSAAIGTDTCFSVIGCATCNGVVGLKPSHRSLSSKGIIPISYTLDSAGCLTRSMEDAVLLYSGMRDKPLADIKSKNINELRLAVNIYQDEEEQVSDAQMARYKRVIDALKADGATVENVSHPFDEHMGDIMCCEFKQDLENYLSASSAKRKTMADIITYYKENPKAMPYGIEILEECVSLGKSDKEYTEAMSERNRLHNEIVEELKKYDACIMTGPTNIMHFTGIPSVALKMCMAEDNTPRGIILYGADEKRLFAAAQTVEKYCLSVSHPII